MKTNPPAKIKVLEARNNAILKSYKAIMADALKLAKKSKQESLLFRIELDHSKNPLERNLLHEFWSPLLHLTLVKGETGELKVHYAVNAVKAEQLSYMTYLAILLRIDSIKRPANFLSEIPFNPQQFQFIIDQVQAGELPFAKMLMYD